MARILALGSGDGGKGEDGLDPVFGELEDGRGVKVRRYILNDPCPPCFKPLC